MEDDLLSSSLGITAAGAHGPQVLDQDLVLQRSKEGSHLLHRHCKSRYLMHRNQFVPTPHTISLRANRRKSYVIVILA